MRSIEIVDGQLLERPNRTLFLTEWIRAPQELAAFYATFGWLAAGRRGDGHPVLVLPGMLADDRSTEPLRTVIAARGLRAFAWEMGPNIGPAKRIMTEIPRRIERLHERFGQTVSLVGWSLGGLLAREFARDCPEHVRDVVTLGSPLRLRASDPPDLTNVGSIYQALRPLHDPTFMNPPRETASPQIPCPSTSIYSRSDGIVPWRSCLDDADETHENVEVVASHCGLGVNPLSVSIVLDRLVQREGEWRPYVARNRLGACHW
jgi:hypothetical protein